MRYELIKIGFIIVAVSVMLYIGYSCINTVVKVIDKQQLIITNLYNY